MYPIKKSLIYAIKFIIFVQPLYFNSLLILMLNIPIVHKFTSF